MKHCRLLNGQILKIREAKVEEAPIIIKYINKIAIESDNLTFGKGEFGVSEEEEVTIIQAIAETANQIMLCAFLDAELVGQLVFRGGQRPRISHAGEFGLSVLQEHWGKGIGNELLKCLLVWAKNTKNSSTWDWRLIKFFSR